MSRELTRRCLLKGTMMTAAATVLAACQPKVVEVEKVVTKVVKEVVKETVIVEGTSQIVEREVTKIVEKVVTAPPAAKEPVVVEVWVQEAFGKEAWASVDEKFHASQSDIRIERSIFPHPDMEVKVFTALAGGEPLSVVYVHPMFNNTYAIRGAIVPLDDYLPDLGIPEDDWFPVFNYHKWRGKLWALPYQDNPVVMGYNPDLVEEAGLDSPRDLWAKGEWTYEKYIEYCEKLTKGQGADKQFGTGISARGSVRGWPSMFIWGHNGRIFNEEETHCMVAEPNAITGWTEGVQSLWEDWCPAPGDLEGVSGAARWERIAMDQTSRWTMMQAAKTGAWPNMKMVPCFTWPSGKAEVRDATNASAIFANCPNKEAAWEWVKWMTIDGHIELIRLGWVTPLRKSLTDQDFWVSQLNLDIEDPAVYNEAAANVRLMSHVVRVSEIDKMIQAAFDAVVLKEKSPEGAMSEIIQDIDDILAETAETPLPSI